MHQESHDAILELCLFVGYRCILSVYMFYVFMLPLWRNKGQ